jgi:hypothetical protein
MPPDFRAKAFQENQTWIKCPKILKRVQDVSNDLHAIFE